MVRRVVKFTKVEWWFPGANKNFWQSRVTDQLSLIYPALRNTKISWLTTQGLFLAHTTYLQHAVHMAKGKKSNG